MKVRFSGTLLRFVNYQREVDVEATTVGSVLEKLVETHPKLKRVLYDGSGQVRESHILFLNGEQLSEGAMSQDLQPDDTLEVVTAVAGG